MSGLTKAIGSLFKTFAEGFETMERQKDPDFTMTMSWIDIVVFLIVLLLVSLFGQILWNNVLAGADKGKGFVTILKPLPSLTDAILMFFAISLFMN